MTLITSLTNPHVVRVRDLHTTRGRKKSGLFLMEGPHLLDALVLADMIPREIYYQPALLQRTPAGRELLARLLHPPTAWAEVFLCEVSERVMGALSDAQTSQGVLAVLPLHLCAAERLLARRGGNRRPVLLILDDLADPGNMGTILRTALAADVQAVLLTARCVDCYSPKVVRAAAGVHVALPIWADLSWSAIEEKINEHCGVPGVGKGTDEDARIFLAEAGGDRPYYAEDLRLPCALIIGSEAHGPSSQARALARHTLSIPLSNQVESLNAAIAAGILLFEAVRQLRGR